MKTVKTLMLLTICVTSLALADDFKTINGKEYKNAKVSRVEPDGIVLITKSGISKVYFSEVPKEMQERFHYDPVNAAQFTAQNAAATKQVQINEKLGEIALEIDKQKLYVREGRIVQVMDDGIVLSRSPTWYADGRPAQWIGPIFVRGSFPAATDGTAMEGWIWPAGTYKVGARTLEAWANSRDIAVKAQVREAAQTSENRQE